MTITATYSPEDNKLRLYPSARLDDETYARVKAAGFKWAPQQQLFVAPMWTPQREDLCIELAGEVGDEDTSLAQRAEERADRFDAYGNNRTTDAENARKAVAAIADSIPLGQPILVGHHSERHARKDAERIENGMRKAVNMWRAAQYWKDRAAGALAHAKYKEQPDVRARRIKAIETELRKVQRDQKASTDALKLWDIIEAADKWKPKEDGTPLSLQERARFIFGRARSITLLWDPEKLRGWTAYDLTAPESERYRDCPVMAPEEIKARMFKNHEQYMLKTARWVEHYENRLTYERAMLAEQGGLVAQKTAMLQGGQVKRRGQWFVIVRVNRESVTVAGHWARTIPNDEISDYRPPQGDDAEKVKAAFKQPPLCNYPGDGFRHMTQAEYDARPEKRWSDSPKTKTHAATETHATHRTPCARREGGGGYVSVYITDKPRKDPPKKEPKPEPIERHAPDLARAAPRSEKTPEAQEFEAIQARLRSGVAVQVVSAPQLFPTPPELASKLVDLARVPMGCRLLEPSAGTGAILRALPGLLPLPGDCRQTWAHVVAVELSQQLAAGLSGLAHEVHAKDFLQCNGDLGTFDRILMNPPFKNGEDIKHIRHALKFLRPGGRLVAICASGPRQHEQLRPLASEWVELGPDAFREAGTGVRAAMLCIEG